MAEARDEQGISQEFICVANSRGRGNPLLAVATDFNSKLLETVANAHKEWAEIVHQRIK